MWTLYNRVSGEYWTGRAWGAITRAVTAPDKQQAEDQWLMPAWRTKVSGGGFVELREIVTVEIDEADSCGHRDQVQRMGTNADGEKVCLACTEREAWIAEEARRAL